MAEKIVVGVTEASGSRRAVEWAVKRAIARNQPIELVSVVGGALGSVGGHGLLNAAVAETEEFLREEADRVAAAGVQVTTRVEAGDPVAVLTEASETAALLVIGSDYRGPTSGPARGSHGVRIAAGSESPVVVVPDIDISDDRSGVVVGVDGSSLSADAIAFAAAEADRLGEPLKAVIVWTPISAPRNSLMVVPEDYRHGMEQAAQEALALSLAGLRSTYPDLQIESIVEVGFPSAVINELAETARLAVVGSRGRGVVRRFLLGSVSHEVLQRLSTVTAVVR